jgi:hypothetical protein
VGPEYYVTVTSFVDKSQLEPGCSVLLNNKVRLVIGVCVCTLWGWVSLVCGLCLCLACAPLSLIDYDPSSLPPPPQRP